MTKDIKLVRYCIDCHKKLQPIHKHHFRCAECWNEYQDKLAVKGTKDILRCSISQNKKSKHILKQSEIYENNRKLEFERLLRKNLDA